MSNEIKVALLAIVAIGLSYWGYKFIKGKDILSNSNIYYVEFDNVSSLNPSTAVVIRGIKVGFVSSVALVPNTDKVKISLDLDKNLQIPVNTVAEIYNNGFMGTKQIRLAFPPIGQRNQFYKSGSYLPGRILGFIGSNITPEEMQKYMTIIQIGLKGALDSLNQELTSDPNGAVAKGLRDLAGTLANLNSATAQLNGILAQSGGNINASMKNLRVLTDNLAANNSKITAMLNNAEKFSGQLGALDLKKTMTSVDETITQLKSTLNKTDNAMSSLNSIAGDLKDGKGSLGKLLKDTVLADNIQILTHRADSLAKDLRARPYRYIPLKGRKRVQRYDRLDASKTPTTNTVVTPTIKQN
jgi:phospholipid/cholesterol/gamma-HCH transport system substrate-binding protein